MCAKVPYGQDLFDSIPYEEFCTVKSYLYHLIFPVDRANKYSAEKRNQAITVFKPGDEVYVDIRVFGDTWYEDLALPDSYCENTYLNWSFLSANCIVATWRGGRGSVTACGYSTGYTLLGLY